MELESHDMTPRSKHQPASASFVTMDCTLGSLTTLTAASLRSSGHLLFLQREFVATLANISRVQQLFPHSIIDD
jgi:hypothetical protein